jgi:hypothetical protein
LPSAGWLYLKYFGFRLRPFQGNPGVTQSTINIQHEQKES